MKRSLDHPIRKANPGTFQSDQEVIRQFVVRNRELDTVLEVLRGNMDASSCQHVLLVAPRGRGKTMLLARVAAELRSNSALSRHLLPVRFMEESLEVFDVADFWLECLFYLARESAVGDPELTRELRDTHRALAARGRGEELIEARARAAVFNAADRLGKQLVLMVENLQDLCGDVDEDFGWKLREALQSQPEIMLLATATSRFKGLDDATQPFFELFRTLGLDPLAIEECQRLWHVVSGDAVGEREVRPLQILTGGSPRLLVYVADFARHGSLRQLMEQLVRLIDEHTEYFRTHLEGFAKTERRVYLATIDLWQPSTTGEITARARLDVRIVSNMLGRLVHRGAVIYEGAGRKRRYSAAERLYGIYYKLRRERDEAAIVRNLIHFMAMFYSKPELSEMSERLSMEAVQIPAIREGIDRVIAEASRRGDIISSEALFVLEQARDQAAELGDWAAAIATFKEVEKRYGDSDSLDVQVKVAMALVGKGIAQGELGDWAAVVATCEEVVERYGHSDSPDLQVEVAEALVTKGVRHGQLGDWAAEVASYEEVVERYGDSDSSDVQVEVAKALVNKGIKQRKLGDFEAAIATCEGVVERYDDSDSSDFRVQVAKALVNKGIAQGELGGWAAEVATYDEVVERYGDSDSPDVQALVARALVSKGIEQGLLGDWAAAIATFKEVVERYGDSDSSAVQVLVAAALVSKGIGQAQLGDWAAEVATCEEVVERYGDSDSSDLQEHVARALLVKGIAQGELGDWEAEVATCEEVVERYGDSDSSDLQVQAAKALAHVGFIQVRIGRAEEALLTSDALKKRYGSLAEVDDVGIDWQAMRLRTSALLHLGDRDAVLEAFRATYVAFCIGKRTMLREMLDLAVELIVFGLSERELAEIMSSDRERADALAPLLVALRKRAGEAVRAPVEVSEVADDILREIEAKMSAAVPGARQPSTP